METTSAVLLNSIVAGMQITCEIFLTSELGIQVVPDGLLAFGTTVKKKESKLYGAHFKEVDFSKKATKMTFDDSDDE